MILLITEVSNNNRQLLSIAWHHIKNNCVQHHALCHIGLKASSAGYAVKLHMCYTVDGYPSLR